MNSRFRRRVIPALLSLLLMSWQAIPWARDPATMYMMECQGCHLSDGSGGLSNIPALKGNVATFLNVPGGREYLVRVPGVALSSLSDEEVTAVLNWMLRDFGPAASAAQHDPYTVDEVARLRKQPLTEVSERRAHLVSLMKPQASHAAP